MTTTSPLLTCPTCRRAFSLAAVSESMVALPDCCFEAMMAAQVFLIVGTTAQKLVRAYDRLLRKGFDEVAGNMATHPDPDARKASVAWRNARGKNLGAARLVHAAGVVERGELRWPCGERSVDPADFAADSALAPNAPKVTCPYCLAVMAS